MNKLFCNTEQSNFLFSDYYTADVYLSLASGIYTSLKRAQTVEFLPNFIGENGFIAEGVDNIYPNYGNTVIQTIDYNCTRSQSNGRIANLSDDESEPEESELDNLHETISVYPNPSSGFIQVESMLEQPLQRIQVYDLNGRLISDKKVQGNVTEFNISSEPTGVYMLNMIYADKVIIRRVVKQ